MTVGRISVSLGPSVPRWYPSSFQDVVAAAAGGLLDETQWVELKLAIPPGNKESNLELARDLASLAPAGGALIVGIKDDNSKAGEVRGVELAGLRDRVAQVARTRIDPPLLVRPEELQDPARPGYGCLLVIVPPSAQAPHMVDHMYWGRADRGKTKLSDQQVQDLRDLRRAQEADMPVLLRELAAGSRLAGLRETGHLHVLAHPITGASEALGTYLSASDASRTVVGLMTSLVARLVGRQYVPHPANAIFPARQADGLRLSSLHPDDLIAEKHLLDLTIGLDGSVALSSSDIARTAPSRGNASPRRAVVVEAVLGLTQHTAMLAGELADTVSGYQGYWQVGVLIDGVQSAIASDFVSDMLRDGTPYSRSEYLSVVSTTTAELVEEPHVVVERLLKTFLFGLHVDATYLPYNPTP